MFFLCINNNTLIHLCCCYNLSVVVHASLSLMVELCCLHSCVRLLMDRETFAIRRMLRVDRKTHRFLIEPLSGTRHVKRSIFKAFVSFVEKLQHSPKEVVRNVFQLIKEDCRSTTGSNIRNINLDCAVDQVHPFAKIDIEKKDFFPAPADSGWKVPLIRELINMRDGDCNTSGWTKEEMDFALEYLCTQ